VSLGEKELKGFDHAVHVYRVELASGESVPAPIEAGNQNAPPENRRLIAAFVAVILVVVGGTAFWFKSQEPKVEAVSIERMAFPLPDKPSIAVLPFTNMSNDTEQEYFVDGMTEDLITDISKISGLFVIARNSVFTYKGQAVNVRQVAEELGVRYVMEGSVRRVGNQVRINAQLIDATTGGHLWAERYDGSLQDIFALQDQVTRKIVSALKISLTDEDQKAFDQVETKIPEAYDTFLRGLEQYQLFSSESMIRARGLFEEAIKIDPNYARAYANIAITYSAEVNFQWTQDRKESIRKGLEYAKSALALDDSIPQIYLARSFLYLSQREHLAAIEAANRTLEVHQNYADGHATLAFILSFSGKLEEALMALNRAKQLNPQATGVYLGVEGRILFLLERYNSAVEMLEKSVDRNPALDRSHLTLAAAYAALGQIDEAAWSVEEALAINSYLTLERERRESLYLRDRDINHYIDALRKAGVPES
jgi:adenylate cyclase